jgi:HSP20 family molecular chaperone IbpA
MDELEEALRNIDIFCKIVVEKMVEKQENTENAATAEPIEDLLRRKYVIEEHFEPNPASPQLIPLPQMEEPLIDVFEDDNYVKVLMQCHCKDQRVDIHTGIDGVQICKKECYTNLEGREICKDECRKLNLPVDHLRIDNMTSKCNNNEVLEIDIPKAKTSVT